MTANAYINDLSEYLKDGTLSDLTLNFGEKSWQIHKALACCHSKWFRKAVTGNFQEAFSGVVTLQDDPEFANAIDCMVSYFYEASYDVSKYDSAEALLHAQVAALADKYDCPSLYKLAKNSFADTVTSVESDDWLAIAAFVYDNTTTELPVHVELRRLIVTTATNRPDLLESLPENKGMLELFRSNADLATDLLLDGLQSPNVGSYKGYYFFKCQYCHYIHAGPLSCQNSAFREGREAKICPQCNEANRTATRRYNSSFPSKYEAFPCPSCEGLHTLSPAETSPEDLFQQRMFP